MFNKTRLNARHPIKLIKITKIITCVIAVSINKVIKYHSIKNFAVKGNPENNKIKNQIYFVNFGNFKLIPVILVKLRVLYFF
jgi:hypothetical protein